MGKDEEGGVRGRGKKTWGDGFVPRPRCAMREYPSDQHEAAAREHELSHSSLDARSREREVWWRRHAGLPRGIEAEVRELASLRRGHESLSQGHAIIRT